MSSPWPSLRIRSTWVNSERSSSRTDGWRSVAASMARSASDRMRSASRIAWDTPYRWRWVRKPTAGRFASGPRYSFASADHALGNVRRRTSSSMMSSRNSVYRWYHSSHVAARSKPRGGRSPVRSRNPASARAYRYRFPSVNSRAFRRIVFEEGNAPTGCSAANSSQTERIAAFDASRYGFRSGSTRGSAPCDSTVAMRSRLSGLEPTRCRRADDDRTILELLDRSRSGQEHRGLEFLDDGAEFRRHRVRGDLRGFEHRFRHTCHRGAEGDSSGDIESAPHAARGDERQADIGQQNRGGGRDPPVPERCAEALFQGRGLLPRPVVLDRGERGSPEPAHVDRLRAGRLEFLGDVARNPSARLLRHDREPRRERFDRREASFRPPVSLGLDDLLEKIQVDDQSVRIDHVDRLLRVRHAVRSLAGLRHELGRPKIRKDERDIVVLHDRIRRREVRFLQSCALRADAHRDADLRGALREVRVDLLPHPEAARHGGDDQRRSEPLAKELHADIDVVQVDLREGRVDEPDIVPVVVLRRDVLLEDDVHMLRLALFRLRRLGHFRDLGRLGCRRPDGPAGHPGRGSLHYR